MPSSTSHSLRALLLLLAIPWQAAAEESDGTPEFSTTEWESDLQELYISPDEVKEIVGQNVYSGLAYNGYLSASGIGGVASVVIVCLVAVVLGGVLFRTGVKEDSGELLGCGGAIAGVFGFATFTTIMTAFSASENVATAKLVRPIWDDVIQLNQTLSNIHVVDELAEVGNPVSIESRDDVLGAIRQTRETVLRALRTDAILRNNPQFDRTQLAESSILPPIKTDELTGRAGELTDALNSALEIDLRARDRLKTMLAKDSTAKQK